MRLRHEIIAVHRRTAGQAAVRHTIAVRQVRKMLRQVTVEAARQILRHTIHPVRRVTETLTLATAAVQAATRRRAVVAVVRAVVHRHQVVAGAVNCSGILRRTRTM
jgi:hypothetical protein